MFYKLQNKKPVRCATGREWAEWYEAATRSGERTVARDELDGILVSTIFSGIDPNPVDADPPQLFETMVFIDGRATGVTIRSATWDHAEDRHRNMVRQMQKARDEEADEDA